MKKIVVTLFVLSSLPSLVSPAFGQTLDTLMMPFMQVSAGDTVIVPVYLRNHTFAVGGIATRIALTDSNSLKIIGVFRGRDILDFAYYAGTYSDGFVRLVTVANMPNYPQIMPLYPGVHEIARIRVAVSDSISYGSYAIIFFDRFGPPLTSLSDSSGYLITNPHTLDGVVFYESPSPIDAIFPDDATFSLGNSYPNPFNASTNIEFALAEPGFATLESYDLLGRKVINLFNKFANAGPYRINWNGKSEMGETLPSGIYFYRLAFGDKALTKKFSLVK